MKRHHFVLLASLAITYSAWAEQYPLIPYLDDTLSAWFNHEPDSPEQRQTRREIADSIDKAIMGLYPCVLLDTTNWKTYCQLYRANQLPDDGTPLGFWDPRYRIEMAKLQILVASLQDPLVKLNESTTNDSTRAAVLSDRSKSVPSSAEWVVDSLGYLTITSLSDSQDAVAFDSLFAILSSSRGMILDISGLQRTREEYVIEAASAFLPRSLDSVGVRTRIAGTQEHTDKLYPVQANQIPTYTKPVVIIDRGYQADWPRRLIRMLLESREKSGTITAGDYHFAGLRGIEPVTVALPRGLSIQIPTATALAPTRQPYFDQDSDLHAVGTNCKVERWPLVYPKSADVSEAIWLLRKLLAEK